MIWLLAHSFLLSILAVTAAPVTWLIEQFLIAPNGRETERGFEYDDE